MNINTNDININVTAEHMQIITEILNQYAPNHAVYAFGSRVKKTNSNASDIDLALEGAPLEILEMSKLKYAFMESDLPYRVDIIEYNAISPEFKACIEHEKVLIKNAKKVDE